jgi:hypothetical protein
MRVGAPRGWEHSTTIGKRETVQAAAKVAQKEGGGESVSLLPASGMAVQIEELEVEEAARGRGGG